MTTQIELKQMRFFARHGVDEQEHLTGNHFTVDLLLSFPFEKATVTDNLADTLSYAAVYDLVRHEMNTSSRLLEHLAGRILAALKRAFPQLTAITLCVTKLAPPLGGDVLSASVILSETYLPG
jgi:dihydroneopterin aldolase